MKKLITLTLLLACAFCIQAQSAKYKMDREYKCSKDMLTMKDCSKSHESLAASLFDDIFEKKCCLTGKVSYVRKSITEDGTVVYMDVKYDRFRGKFIEIASNKTKAIKV